MRVPTRVYFWSGGDNITCFSTVARVFPTVKSQQPTHFIDKVSIIVVIDICFDLKSYQTLSHEKLACISLIASWNLNFVVELFIHFIFPLFRCQINSSSTCVASLTRVCHAIKITLHAGSDASHGGVRAASHICKLLISLLSLPIQCSVAENRSLVSKLLKAYGNLMLRSAGSKKMLANFWSAAESDISVAPSVFPTFHFRALSTSPASFATMVLVPLHFPSNAAFLSQRTFSRVIQAAFSGICGKGDNFRWRLAFFALQPLFLGS